LTTHHENSNKNKKVIFNFILFHHDEVFRCTSHVPHNIGGYFFAPCVIVVIIIIIVVSHLGEQILGAPTVVDRK